jgi:hypothetical protein
MAIEAGKAVNESVEQKFFAKTPALFVIQDTNKKSKSRNTPRGVFKRVSRLLPTARRHSPVIIR